MKKIKNQLEGGDLMSSRCGISGKKFNEEKKFESPDGDSDENRKNDGKKD